VRSLSRPKQQEARPKVRGRKSRIEQADFGAHEGSMTLCSQEVQGEAVGAGEAAALAGCTLCVFFDKARGRERLCGSDKRNDTERTSWLEISVMLWSAVSRFCRALCAKCAGRLLDRLRCRLLVAAHLPLSEKIPYRTKTIFRVPPRGGIEQIT
jgi:hypothetical protein